MSKSKPQSFESVRREIARRLQAQLPLAGMIAATTLLCGCNERPSRGRLTGVPASDTKQCEQKSEQQKPKTPAPPEKNERNEKSEKIPMGDVPYEPNRPREVENSQTTGVLRPAPNQKREEIEKPVVAGILPPRNEEK